MESATGSFPKPGEIVYAADQIPPYGLCARPWRPSCQMPRWASRLTLQVESVMVERVNAIDDFDAESEGIPYIDNGRGIHQWAACGKWYDYARDAFAHLWESIHGKGAWERNDWVWAIKFKVCN